MTIIAKRAGVLLSTRRPRRLRRHVALAAGLALLLGAGVSAVTARPTHTGGPAHSRVRGDAERGALAAREACVRLSGVVVEVTRNASSEAVARDLGRARSTAAAAATLDAQWTELDSGARGLERSLHVDDARLADVSLRVIRGQCARLGLTVGVTGGP